MRASGAGMGEPLQLRIGNHHLFDTGGDHLVLKRSAAGAAVMSAPMSAFEGTYEGSEAGTFTGSIYSNGGAIADVDSPSAGFLPAAGRVMPNGAMMFSSTTTSGGSTLTVTFSGNV